MNNLSPSIKQVWFRFMPQVIPPEISNQWSKRLKLDEQLFNGLTDPLDWLNSTIKYMEWNGGIGLELDERKSNFVNGRRWSYPSQRWADQIWPREFTVTFKTESEWKNWLLIRELFLFDQFERRGTKGRGGFWWALNDKEDKSLFKIKGEGVSIKTFPDLNFDYAEVGQQLEFTVTWRVNKVSFSFE